MNEESPTQEKDPAEAVGSAESNVITAQTGGEGVLAEAVELPSEIPPVPSVCPAKGNRYTPRGGPR